MEKDKATKFDPPSSRVLSGLRRDEVIPEHILSVLQKLENAGFEAYLVGGCVRDLFLKREIKDWDIATNAKPDEIMAVFPDSVYENDFGTVGVKIKKKEERRKKKDLEIEIETEIVEVTTFRVESKYSDKRHPDEIKFAKTLEEDLSRRDFTMNGIALRITNLYECTNNNFKIIDLSSGQKDIKNKIIRAVGEAGERFKEDALRMMRAIRFYSQFGFEIEKKTLEAIKKNASNLKFVSRERIKDELVKIILSDNPSEGIDMLHKTGLLDFVIPELERGVGVDQNRHHVYTIYKHNLLSLKFCPSEKLETRLAALFHDIAKPQTKRGEGEFATFYNHDHVGARVARKILERLKFSRNIIDKVFLLVDNHMFYYNPEEVSESSVRRLIQKVGLENMKDLMDLRISDRLGSGTPKAKPYKLRHMEYVIDKVSQDAVSVKMLKINGNDLMRDLNIAPGPIIGAIMDVLLSEVIEDASKNNRENLLSRAKELMKLDLEKLRQMAKKKIEEKKEEGDEEIKKKHWVK